MGRDDDIGGLPHHVSVRHAPMPMSSRAAQFSPFAALTGYETAVTETARLTDARIELTEESRAELDRRQRCLMENAGGCPEVRVTFFVPDERKIGGSYRTVVGRFKRVDPVERVLLLTDGKKISLDDILELESGETD